MNKTDTIISIVNLPEKFNNSENNKSIYSLLKETGYFELHSQINEDDIGKALAKHPTYINQWLQWSEDKRSSSGWYFQKNDSHNYIVSYFPTNENFEQTIYSNIRNACAAFIKREIEAIRKI